MLPWAKFLLGFQPVFAVCKSYILKLWWVIPHRFATALPLKNPCYDNSYKRKNEENKLMNVCVRRIKQICQHSLEKCRTVNCYCNETEVEFFIIATKWHGITRTCCEISWKPVVTNSTYNERREKAVPLSQAHLYPISNRLCAFAKFLSFGEHLRSLSKTIGLVSFAQFFVETKEKDYFSKRTTPRKRKSHASKRK